jgi:predicted MFS family arabinose efflux permease
MFVINGAVVGCWVAQIPFLQARFDLANAALGLVILAHAIGAILATLVAGQAIARHGSARVLRISAPACAALLALPLLAAQPALTAVALLALGAASGAMDVSMNAQGVAVEQAGRRPVMSSLHAGWSLGGLLGSGAVALATAAGVEPRLQLAIAAAVLALLVLALGRRVGPGSARAGATAAAFVLPARAVLVLAVLALLIMVMEGAMADWSGVYLRRELEAQASLAALGFGALSLGMLLGRLVGDRLNARLGPVAMLRRGALLAGAALAVALLAAQPVVVLLAVVAIGLGVANGVPVLFSAAGRTGEGQAGPGIAAVSSLGSLGFLAGPPLIGLTADAVSLPAALAALCVAMGAVALAADAVT